MFLIGNTTVSNIFIHVGTLLLKTENVGLRSGVTPYDLENFIFGVFFVFNQKIYVTLFGKMLFLKLYDSLREVLFIFLNDS